METFTQDEVGTNRGYETKAGEASFQEGGDIDIESKGRQILAI